MSGRKAAPTMILRGPVRVSFRKAGREWWATALEFDIAGYGRSRRAAFAMLQELMLDYLREIARLVHAGKPVKFFNPSREEEWNGADVEDYLIVCTVERGPDGVAMAGSDYRGLGRLIDFIDSLDELDVKLVPA